MLFNNAPLLLNWLKCLGEQPVQQSSPLRASPRAEWRADEILHRSTQAASSFPPKGEDTPRDISNYPFAILLPCYLIPKTPNCTGVYSVTSLTGRIALERLQATVSSGLCSRISLLLFILGFCLFCFVFH